MSKHDARARAREQGTENVPLSPEKLDAIKKWIFSHTEDGTVSSFDLADYIKTQRLEPNRVVKKLTEERLLFGVPAIGRLGVDVPSDKGR